MRWRLLVITALVLAIGILTIVIHRHGHIAEATARPLIAAAPAAVTSVRATWASGMRIALKRDRSGWRVIRPVNAPADPTRVHAFLAALGEPIARSYPIKTLALASTGLAPPKLVLAAGGIHLAFGRVNPANGLRYIRRGNSVLLVADTVLPRLDAGPWQFVDTHLIPRGLTVHRVHLPGAATQSNPALIAAWQAARARTVEPLAKSGTKDMPRITVALGSAHAPLVFALSARKPKLRIARPAAGIQYVLPASAASRLLPAGPNTTPAKTHARTSRS